MINSKLCTTIRDTIDVGGVHVAKFKSQNVEKNGFADRRDDFRINSFGVSTDDWSWNIVILCGPKDPADRMTLEEFDEEFSDPGGIIHKIIVNRLDKFTSDTGRIFRQLTHKKTTRKYGRLHFDYHDVFCKYDFGSLRVFEAI